MFINKVGLKFILVLTFCLILSCVFMASHCISGVFLAGTRIPQPQLFYPTSENVDLQGKETLDFRWSTLRGSPADRRYYDFRLYKGYDISEDSLIYKEQVSPFKGNLSIKSSFFSDKEVYTWSLRQVYLAGKSDRSTVSFTIHK